MIFVKNTFFCRYNAQTHNICNNWKSDATTVLGRWPQNDGDCIVLSRGGVEFVAIASCFKKRAMGGGVDWLCSDEVAIDSQDSVVRNLQKKIQGNF